MATKKAKPKHKVVKKYKGFEIVSYGYTWRVGPPINKRFYFVDNAKKAIDAWERRQYKKDKR